MKFNLGDQVHYQNKNDKRNFVGTVIAIQKLAYNEPYYLIETDSQRPEDTRWMIMGSVTDRNYAYRFLGDRFEARLPGNRILHTKQRNAMWINARSKCLRHGILEYDPTQQGDTDDDI